MAFPPNHPFFPPFPLPGRLLLLSYGPGVGVGVPPPSGVTTSLVNSTAMRVLLPLLLTLLPLLGLPLTPPPLSMRLWVIQRLLCFLPLLPIFQGVIPVPLVPSTLLWPWVLRAPPAVVILSASVLSFLYCLG